MTVMVVGQPGVSGQYVTESVALDSAGGDETVVTLPLWDTGWTARDTLWKVRNVMLTRVKVRMMRALSKLMCIHVITFR